MPPYRRKADASCGTDNLWQVNSGERHLSSYALKTGEIKDWSSPSGPRSYRYPIVVIEGVNWCNESGQRPDTLVRFDPKNESFQSWPIPSGNVHAGTIRHMRRTPDGSLVMHQSSTNRIILATPSRMWQGDGMPDPKRRNLRSRIREPRGDK